MEIGYGMISEIRRVNGIVVTDTMKRNEEWLINTLVRMRPCRFMFKGRLVSFRCDYTQYDIPNWKLYMDDDLIFQFNETMDGRYVITYMAYPASNEVLERINTIVLALINNN